MMIKENENNLYVNINGYAVPYVETPCSKCPQRYSIGCPTCNWNRLGIYNTYQNIEPKNVRTFKEAIKEKGGYNYD